MLTQADLALHAALGIDAAALELMCVRRVTDHEARDVLAVTTRNGRLDGLLYPYIDPVTRHVVTHRLRRDHPDFEQGKPKNKYLSAFGDHRHLYFVCADGGVLADVSAPVVIVEAEKGGLAVYCAGGAMQRSILPIGLGGCFGWRGRIGKVETANGGRVDDHGPLPDFDHVTWAGRDVILVFDSNAARNTNVQAARRALGIELTRRGAKVRIVDLPLEDGINGPDDYLGRHGPAKFFAAVDAAPDAATFDAVFRLNQRHGVVREAGKTVVIIEEEDPVLRRRVVTRTSFTDFRNFYLHESVRVGTTPDGQPIMKPLGHMWLAHPDRRQYDGVVMSPDRDMPGYLNLWRGFAVEPKPGSCQRFKAHVYEVICSENAGLYDYVWGWLAMGVQHPERRAEVAIALRGLRGVGKGVFVRTYGELFGQHYLHVANTKHLTGHFNAHLQDAIVLFADEAFWAGDKSGESVLKMLITEAVIPIERKGHDVVLAKNMLHLILASNHEWLVPAGLDERRFCVLDVADCYQQDRAYFDALTREIEAGGREALLYELLHHPIGDFDIRAVPQTEALRQQKVLSMLPNERWLFDKLMSGRWLPEHDTWQDVVPKDALHLDYIQNLQRVGVDRRATETELGMFIARVLNPKTTRRMIDGKNRRCWIWGNLADCRLAFDRATHSQHPWADANG